MHITISDAKYIVKNGVKSFDKKGLPVYKLPNFYKLVDVEISRDTICGFLPAAIEGLYKSFQQLETKSETASKILGY